jgi:hypothetical protein
VLTAIATSQGNLIFVDIEGLNDRVTSSIMTRRSGEFRRQIVRRDGSCVITGNARHCDAAHLIPRVKGDKVISSVIWIFKMILIFYSSIFKGLFKIVLI